MSAIENLEPIFKVIEGGKEITDTSKIVNLTTDSGKVIAQGIKKSAISGNGRATTVFSKTTTNSAGAAITSGLGILAVDVGAVGMALAPVLGVIGGLALADVLSPGTMDTLIEELGVSDKLIGGKVIGYVDNNNNIAFDEEVIEIYKRQFVNSGVYNANYIPPESISVTNAEISNFTVSNSDYLTKSQFYKYVLAKMRNFRSVVTSCNWTDKDITDVLDHFYKVRGLDENSKYFIAMDIQWYKTNYGFINIRQSYYEGTNPKITLREANTYGIRGLTISSGCEYNYDNFNYYKYKISGTKLSYQMDGSQGMAYYNQCNVDDATYLRAKYTTSGWNFFGASNLMVAESSPYAMQNAVQPTNELTIPEIYPSYSPLELPYLDPASFLNLYRVMVPSTISEATSQEQAQNPDNIQNPDELLDFLIDYLPIPDPATEPEPLPKPEVDNDPQPEIVPLPEPLPVPVPNNPPNPNPDPSDDITGGEFPVTPMVPVIPSTTGSSKLFTVYNPTASQLDELGAFLWDNDILDQIVRIWTNPMDGVISLRRVYGTPVCGTNSPIQLGNLTTDIVSKVVTDQFIHINCGTITVPEIRKNATDYPPYTNISIYLPFIGIMELDSAEVMNSELTLYYHIDAYTGTCLAEIYVKRKDDLTEPQVLYTFTGNCSQTLPLTSQDASGLISSLMGLGATAVAVSSGGSLGAVGAGIVGHSLTQNMKSVIHSGALSSNAGIMGQRKPYLIISRQQSYDANGYSELYGFPSNVTVYLGNCSGFQKVKAIRLQSEATEEEKKEIETLLYEGVIV